MFALESGPVAREVVGMDKVKFLAKAREIRLFVRASVVRCPDRVRCHSERCCETS